MVDGGVPYSRDLGLRYVACMHVCMYACMHARTHTCSEHTRPHICLASWLVDKYPIAVCQARGKKKKKRKKVLLGPELVGRNTGGPGSIGLLAVG